jgi:hypothetical protein
MYRKLQQSYGFHYLLTSIAVPNPNSTLPARHPSAEPNIDENVTSDQEKTPVFIWTNWGRSDK